jgi:agmatinase
MGSSKRGRAMASINNIFGGTAATTFMGLPKGSLDKIESGIGVLGIPVATPYAVTGPYAAGMPGAVRKAVAGYGTALDHMDFDLGGRIRGDGRKAICDYGDLPWDAKDFEKNRTRIRSTIAAMLKSGTTPVVIGGDDSVPIPIYQAFRGHGPLDILLIDAHTDFRDEVNGEKLGLSSTMRRASEMGHVGKLVMAGQRSIGSARIADYEEALKRSVTIVTARQLHAEGHGAVIEAIPKGGRLWINLDVDAMDPSIMPAVIGPAPGGLSYWQVVELISGAAARTRLAGFSMVEFVAEKDGSGLAALNLARILCNVLGIMART